MSSYKPDTECYKEVVAHFDPIAQEELGRNITNPTTGEIDRKTLGELVFGNDNRLQDLQDLVWPRILQSLEASIAFHKKKAEEYGKEGVVVVEAAVLLKAGWDHLCDEVWEIEVSKERAIRRLVKKRNFTVTQAEEISSCFGGS